MCTLIKLTKKKYKIKNSKLMIKCFDEIILTITLYTRYICVGIVYLQCRSYTLNLQVFIICQLTLIRNRIKRSLIEYLVALCITVQCGVQCSTYYGTVLYRCLYTLCKEMCPICILHCNDVYRQFWCSFIDVPHQDILMFIVHQWYIVH